MQKNKIDLKEIESNTELEVLAKETVLNELEINVNAIVIENEEQFKKATELLKAVKSKITDVEKKRKSFVTPLNNIVKDINARIKKVSSRAVKIKDALDKKLVAYHDVLEKKRLAEAEKAKKEELARLEEQRKKETEEREAKQKAEREERERLAKEKAEKDKELAEARSFFSDDDKPAGPIDPVEPELKEIESEPTPEPTETEKEIEALKAAPVTFSQQTVKTDLSTTTFKTYYDIKIVNSDLVPRDYCKPDEKLIKDVVKAKNGIVSIPGVEIITEKRTVSR
jgi:hypothetical protein